jgi:hypothetical protein
MIKFCASVLGGLVVQTVENPDASVDVIVTGAAPCPTRVLANSVPMLFEDLSF